MEETFVFVYQPPFNENVFYMKCLSEVWTVLWRAIRLNNYLYRNFNRATEVKS